MAKLDALIDRISFLDEEKDEPTSEDSGQLSFHELKADPGRPGLESVFREINKLKTIRNLDLPDDLYRDVPPYL